MRLFHGSAAKTGVSDVWHADFQQFPRVSWLEETRLLLSMERGPASCAGHAKTQDACQKNGQDFRVAGSKKKSRDPTASSVRSAREAGAWPKKLLAPPPP